MRVYLDNCCFNRPFDDQSQLRIRLEAEAQLHIQEAVLKGNLELAWSYILDYENAANPFDERRSAIGLWRDRATVDVIETPEVLHNATELQTRGLKSKDALHVSCAIAAACDFFVTTDESILKKLHGFTELAVLDPTTFVRSINL